MPFPVYSSFVFGDTLLIYFEKDQQLGLAMIPAAMADLIPEHRKDLKDTVGCRDLARQSGYPFPAYDFESLVQLKLAGDPWALQNAAGLSMRNSGSCPRFKLKEQKADAVSVETFFSDGSGLEVVHSVSFVEEAGLFEINTEFINNSGKPVKLEYLASFSIGLLSLFQSDDSVGKVHRFLSSWSAECRPEIRTIEEMGLEASWQGAGVRSLRFGQFAGIPVRNFYPFLGFEDDRNQVFWGASVVAPGSWEMELSRRDDFLNLSGGLPGRESNAWCKIIAPQEHFAGPCAAVGCVQGKAEDFYSRLRAYQNEMLFTLPEKAHDFPLVFNEWCSTWGKPGVKQIRPILEKLPELGAKYLSLDAGWFVEEGCKSVIGDWDEAKSRYPEGLAAFTQEMLDKGITPGVWFEFENANINSKVFKEHPEYFLHLDGEVLRIGESVCFNFEKPEVWRYLDEKMIAMLRKNKFGYMKVDYNVVIPCGSDSDDGAVPAEVMRRHTEAVCAYFEHIRQELPELVIESCASGGHRISPWWVRFADMVSGSDAHEGWEIPIISAYQSLLIPARALQVWAAVRGDDSSDRLHYSLAAGCLGRLVLSGNPDLLDEKQFAIVKEALAFYRKIVPVLKDGKVSIPCTAAGRWNNPSGYQVVRREKKNLELVVFHTFADSPEEIILSGNGRIVSSFLPDGVVCASNGSIVFKNLRPFSGGAVLLER